MTVKPFVSQFLQSISYLVIENGHAIIIDPCHTSELERTLSNNDITIDFAILTHEHCDHISGVTWIQSMGIKVLCSSKCAENMQSSKKNGSRYFDVFFSIQEQFKREDSAPMEEFTCHADRVVDGDMQIEWRKHTICLRETPGHSAGGICIIFDNTILFSGDSLFKDIDVNFGFIGGSKKQYNDITVPWIKGLSNDMLVYPGHWDSFSLREKTEKI